MAEYVFKLRRQDFSTTEAIIRVGNRPKEGTREHEETTVKPTYLAIDIVYSGAKDLKPFQIEQIDRCSVHRQRL